MELENSLLLVSATAITLKQMSEGTLLTVVVLGLPRATPPSSITHSIIQPCHLLSLLLNPAAPCLLFSPTSVFKSDLPALKG